MSSFTSSITEPTVSVPAPRVPRITTVFGAHRIEMRAGRVTDHTQARHTGEHHMGWSVSAACPRCYPSSYATDNAKHRAEGRAA